MSELKRSDIILVGEHKYLIYSLTKKIIELLPVSKLFEEVESIELIPKMSISRESLGNYEVVDRFEILCLLNQKNPLIVEALEYFLENEEE